MRCLCGKKLSRHWKILQKAVDFECISVVGFIFKSETKPKGACMWKYQKETKKKLPVIPEVGEYWMHNTGFGHIYKRVENPIVVPCSVGYRHIPPSDYNTPLMYLPMQRTTINVREPCGIEEAKDALIDAFGPTWFRSRDDIRDVEIERHNDDKTNFFSIAFDGQMVHTSKSAFDIVILVPCGVDSDGNILFKDKN